MSPIKNMPFKFLSYEKREQFNKHVFIKYFLYFVSLFLLYHMVVWFFWTSKIFGAESYYVGDLARLGYQIDSIQARDNKNTLPVQHFNKTNYHDQHVDILTIGDSFSNGMGGGKNAYYQDFIASEYNMSILNIHNIKPTYNYIETISILYNSGWLKRVAPKVIILESVGVKMLIRFARPVRWELTLPLKEIKKNLFNQYWKPFIPPLKPINTANYKFPYFNFLYHFSDHAFGQSKVYKLKLNQPLFTSKVADDLLVYKDDIERLSQPNETNIKTMNENFNKLAHLLKKENIQLFVMPAVDKYDLYEPYIKNNQYPKNRLFDLLTTMPKAYTLINTKNILAPLLAEGTKDVFYADDTHWGPTASEKIAQSSFFKKIKYE